MKHKKNGFILNTAFIFEKILAAVVLIAVFLGTIDVLRLIWDTYIVNFENIIQYEQLNDMLGQILLLVIGVELVVMLSLHLPGALIEALLYAIARKMLLIPKKEGMLEILLGVIAIAGLFIIKKYLIDHHEDNENEKTLEDHKVDFVCKALPIFCKNRKDKNHVCTCQKNEEKDDEVES